jgi:hypothetical protein
MNNDEKAVVAAIKEYAAKVGQAIDYVPDRDVLGVVSDLIEQAPQTFPISRYPR